MNTKRSLIALNPLLKIRSLLSTDLARVSFLNAISTVIKMFTGLISIKIVSTIIGPTGIAQLGQLNNFSTIVLIVANGGINVGITKYISEYDKDEQAYATFLSTGFWITCVFSLLTGLFLILGAGYLSQTILHDLQYRPVFYIFGGTIIFYGLNAYLIAILNGFKDYNRYVIANILGSLVGLVFTIVLSVRYKTMGALISTITFQSVVFILSLYIVRKAKWLDLKLITRHFRTDAAKKLSHFSLMALVSAITVPGSQLFARGYITQKVSLTDAGLWEGVNRISSMYLFVIMTSLSVYFLPKLAGLKSNKEIRHEVMGVYKLMLSFLAFTVVAIYLLRDLVIHILFTPEFAGMRDLFAFQLIGDVVKMSGWVLGYVLIAKAMTRTYVLLECMNLINAVILNTVLINLYGTVGATFAYVATNLIYLLAVAYIHRGILFPKENMAPITAPAEDPVDINKKQAP